MKSKLIEKWESAIEAAEFYGKEGRLIEYMKNFVDDLNRLEESDDDLYILKLKGGYVSGFELESGRVVGLERQKDFGSSVVMATKPFMEFIQKQVGGELYNITNPKKYHLKLKNSMMSRPRYLQQNPDTEEWYVGVLGHGRTSFTEQELESIDERGFERVEVVT